MESSNEDYEMDAHSHDRTYAALAEEGFESDSIENSSCVRPMKKLKSTFWLAESNSLM